MIDLLREEIATLAPLLSELLKKTDQAARIRTKFRERKMKLWNATFSSWTNYLNERGGSIMISGTLPPELVKILQTFASEYEQILKNEFYFSSLLHTGIYNAKKSLETAQQHFSSQTADETIRSLFITTEELIGKMDSELIQYRNSFQPATDMLDIIKSNKNKGIANTLINSYDAFGEIKELLLKEITREKQLLAFLEQERENLTDLKKTVEEQLIKQKIDVRGKDWKRYLTKWGGFFVMSNASVNPVTGALVIIWCAVSLFFEMDFQLSDKKLSANYIKQLEQFTATA